MSASTVERLNWARSWAPHWNSPATRIDLGFEWKNDASQLQKASLNPRWHLFGMEETSFPKKNANGRCGISTLPQDLGPSGGHLGAIWGHLGPSGAPGHYQIAGPRSSVRPAQATRLLGKSLPIQRSVRCVALTVMDHIGDPKSTDSSRKRSVASWKCIANLARDRPRARLRPSSGNARRPHLGLGVHCAASLPKLAMFTKHHPPG